MSDVQLHGEVRGPVCGLASQLWVPGRADWYPYRHGRGTGRGVWVGGSEGPYAKFATCFPTNSSTL
eukprot:1139502-Pelagomonas_calceolata.AAC.11